MEKAAENCVLKMLELQMICNVIEIDLIANNS